MLEPLKQWYCDRCGRVIERPEDGWFHWRVDDDHKAHSFEILHHMSASPFKKHADSRGCYPEDMDHDMHLDQMLGSRGIVDLLSMLDVGSFHDQKGTSVGRVKDIRGWTEVFRRLHVPFYEEARRYFDRARRDGEIDGDNEVALYLEDRLRGIVERYENED